jgi:endonuclease/exonuclease/phosphatase (EEP) superfamily protein YafD
MKKFIEVFGLLMVAFSLLPMIRTTNRWVRMLDFPRIQIALFLSLSLVIYLIFWFSPQPFPVIWIGALVLALVIQARMIFRFTPLARIEAVRNSAKEHPHAFSMMVANVRMENGHKQPFIKLVRENNPDLLLVNEPDQRWADQLKVLEKDYPYSVQNPLGNTYGMMLFSKLALHHSQVLYRVEQEIPSIHTQVELPSGERFDLYGVHPQPPTHSNDTEKREAELLMVGREVKKTGRPSIVAGDLNDVGWSISTNLFKKISGMLDPRIGRGFFNTYNVFVPFFRYPLDHIFYSPQFQLIDMKRLPAFGSDHFPILIRLCFSPGKAYKQPIEPASLEDKEIASQLIQEGLESRSKTGN